MKSYTVGFKSYCELTQLNSKNQDKNFHLCVGTVIDKHWILTAATCCRDDIVTIKFNDYSIFTPGNFKWPWTNIARSKNERS